MSILKYVKGDSDTPISYFMELPGCNYLAWHIKSASFTIGLQGGYCRRLGKHFLFVWLITNASTPHQVVSD